MRVIVGEGSVNVQKRGVKSDLGGYGKILYNKIGIFLFVIKLHIIKKKI